MLSNSAFEPKGRTSLDSACLIAPGFDAVGLAFTANIEEGLDLGAAFAVTLEGEVVVDLWGGHMDRARTLPVSADTLFPIWSATKGATAMCIALLVERGSLDYERPVARYWPDFAAKGKGEITVAQLLSHQAGLCGVRTPISIDDYYRHDRLAALLAAEEPFFKPGTAWGYHALSLGVLADELIRRVDGRTASALFADEFARPFQLDMFMGLPDEARQRLAGTVLPDGDRQMSLPSIPVPDAFTAAFENPPLEAAYANDPAWHRAGIPAAGMSANARGLSQLYAIMANQGWLRGGRPLSPTTIAAATRQRVEGIDQVTGNYRRHAAGFHLNERGWMGPNDNTFGHAGWGGSIGFADPKARLSIGFAVNRMRVAGPNQTDKRIARLVSAVYDAIIPSRR
ncbi:serine hydrolase domain-containing protein [Sphingobium sp. WCS2017Hpa-17]|uniref:serine hydrolase domain-containing protein n=1 Tax=Sphingobium sp. WCS2017Hpa-17 TaxID=3073638 RepID=UPI0028896DDA|nr:serine hydrolase domain-containing protein [Sphingobium sp. WCS2017Hpa-17]